MDGRMDVRNGWIGVAASSLAAERLGSLASKTRQQNIDKTKETNRQRLAERRQDLAESQHQNALNTNFESRRQKIYAKEKNR